MEFKLVSHKLCPYAQRNIIVMLEKNLSFNTLYIELDKKPKWFDGMSPTGKVPVLQIGNDVLFESAVINEYLDETHNTPSMQPTDPMQRAYNRAWTEYSSKILTELYKLILSKDESEFQDNLTTLTTSFKILEQNIKHKPFFNGNTFSLVDAAYAPVFTRLKVLNAITTLNLYPARSRIATWESNLLARNSVKQSMVPDFADLLGQRIKNSDSHLAGLAAQKNSRG